MGVPPSCQSHALVNEEEGRKKGFPCKALRSQRGSSTKGPKGCQLTAGRTIGYCTDNELHVAESEKSSPAPLGAELVTEHCHQ